MKKEPVTTTTHELGLLIAEVRGLIESARHAAATTVNTLQVLTNFEIGRRIVEHEQKGEKRAGYGQELLKTLSARLTDEFGKGFSKANLEYMRRFYLEWQNRDPQIAQKASGQLSIFQTAAGKSGKPPFTLSWSHTISILLCKRKKEAIVELTLPADANIHAREYQLYLPSKEVLRQKLLDWVREQEMGV